MSSCRHSRTAGLILTFLFCIPAHAYEPQTDPGTRAFTDLDRSGADLIDDREYSKAEQYYRDALEQARRAGDQAWTAEFLRRIGETYHRRGDYRIALTWYEQALTIRESLGDTPEKAYLLVGTGLAKSMLGDYDAAEARVKRGRALYHQLGKQDDEANAFNLLIQIADKRGDLDKAGREYVDLIAFYEKAGSEKGLAAAHAGRAELYRRRSQYRAALQEAFSAVEHSAAARKGITDREQLRNIAANEANALETLANVYQNVAQRRRALDYYERALRMREEWGDTARAAFTLTNRAPVYVALGQPDKATVDLEKALRIRRQIGNPALTATTLNALGEAQLGLGKRDEARKTYEEALELTQGKAVEQASTALYQLGNIEMDAGNLDKALDFHQRALAIREKARRPYETLRSLNRMAVLQERRGDLADAERLHARALQQFERLTVEITDPVELASFRETSARLFPNFTYVLYKEGKIRDALAIAERSRGQALRRMYGARNASFVELLTAAERAEWDRATGALGKAANRLRIAEEGEDDVRRDIAYAGWAEANKNLGMARDRIFAENPRLQENAAGREPGADELIGLSKANPRTLFLEWMVVDDDRALLFTLAAGEVNAHPLSCGGRTLRDLTAAWRASILRSGGRGATRIAGTNSGASEIDTARKLYAAAFGGAQKVLDSTSWKRIVAVADGPLLDIPIAALDNGGHRLIESAPVSYAVSLGSLVEGSARGRAATEQLLVVGDPMERVVAPSGERYTALAHAKEEIQSIAALFPIKAELVRQSAREAEVKKQLGCCSVIHFATHGVLDPDNGMNSGLVLAPEPEDSREDGLLQAWEIAGMRLNARLAVLSACDTAQGDARLGEGLVGLAWAFQAAGTPAVVASLWNVDDRATAQLMAAFYRELRKGSPIDEALRHAMLTTRDRVSGASPYYWAAFSVIGRGDTVQ